MRILTAQWPGLALVLSTHPLVELRVLVVPPPSLLPYSANVKLTARLSALAVRKIWNKLVLVANVEIVFLYEIFWVAIYCHFTRPKRLHFGQFFQAGQYYLCFIFIICHNCNFLESCSCYMLPDLLQCFQNTVICIVLKSIYNRQSVCLSSKTCRLDFWNLEILKYWCCLLVEDFAFMAS